MYLLVILLYLIRREAGISPMYTRYYLTPSELHHHSVESNIRISDTPTGLTPSCIARKRPSTMQDLVTNPAS